MIQLRNISKSFEDKRVLKEIHLEITTNQCYAIVGKNGAGKSTLFNILTNLVAADKGEVEILNTTYRKDARYIKQQLGLMLEQKALVEEFTGLQYLEFVSLLYGKQKEIGKDKINSLFSYFFEDIEDGNKLIRSYSTGMKQKVAFCAAVLHQPQILILDEPFAGLDPFSAQQLVDFLNEYNKDRIILIASHNLAYIEQLASHIGILQEGELLFDGSMEAFTADGKKVLSDSLFQILQPKTGDLEKVGWLM
jgi:ABC-2 type transport system ATP-binding protein